MKKILFILILISSAVKIYAQAPVTDISWLPSDGDKFYIYRITMGQTSNPYINPGDTGANVIWDFDHKKFMLNFPSDSVIFKIPSAIPVTPVNSQANLASGDSTKNSCYIKNSNGFALTQTRNTAKNNPDFPITKTVYVNLRLFFKNNLSFRDSYTDTSIYYQNYKYSGLDSPSRGKSISVQKYDSYGTLKVSGLQFDNVIRTYEERDQWDSSFNSNTKFYSFSKIYTWHSAILKNALLTYIEAYNVKKDGNSLDTTRFSSLTLKLPSSYPTSIFSPSAPQDNINAYINESTIYLSAKENEVVYYTIYDLQGKKLDKGKLKIAGNSGSASKVNVQHLKPGTYILHVKNQVGLEKSFKLFKN